MEDGRGGRRIDSLPIDEDPWLMTQGGNSMAGTVQPDSNRLSSMALADLGAVERHRDKVTTFPHHANITKPQIMAYIYWTVIIRYILRTHISTKEHTVWQN